MPRTIVSLNAIRTSLPLGYNGLRTSGRNHIFITASSELYRECFLELGQLFSSHRVTSTLETTLSRKLTNTYLRMALHVDSAGFWLHPHTDLKAKLVTLIIYVGHHSEPGSLGTDLYDCTQGLVCTVPASSNTGLLFAPGANTYHGVRKRFFQGERRTLVVNYVTAEWQSRNELFGQID